MRKKEHPMTRRDIAQLQTINEYPSVSILLPTHRTIPEKLQDPIRLKDLIRTAFNRLTAEFPERELTSLFAHLDKLYDQIDFTATLDGLALFANKHFSALYILPFPVKEQVVIDKSFDTKHLVFELNRLIQYFVLALSKNSTRLFRGLGNNFLYEIIEPEFDAQGNPISGFPLNDLGPEQHRALAIGTGDKDAAYLEAHDKQFFRFVDGFLDKFLQHEQLPVFLLGAGKDRELFMHVTKHKKSIVEQLHGNFDEASPLDIMHAVEPLLKNYIKQKHQAALAELEEAIGTLHYAAGFEPVWHVAQTGRVHKLLIERGLSINGTFNPEKPEQVVLSTQVAISPTVDDLVDYLIETVLSKRGEVIFVEPGTLAQHQKVAAILRY